MHFHASTRQEVAQELERHADASAKPGERSVGTSGDANQSHSAVSGWATKMLPDVRQHLDQAKQLESKVK